MKSLLTKLACIFLFASFIFFACKSDDELNIVYPEGGYPYLKNVADDDTNFYFLPTRHLFSRSDSFLVLNEKYCFDAFDEPNLSFTPPNEDVFRFSYGCSFCGKFAFVTLTRTKIILKKNTSGVPYPNDSIDLLSAHEKQDYRLMDLYFKYNILKTNPDSWTSRNLDSMLKANPRLTDPQYFWSLKKKISIPFHQPFSYKSIVTEISNEKFKYFVGLINNSEFWQRPRDKSICKNIPMDGDGFSLEAATKKKYYYLVSDYCLDNEGKSNFKKVSEEILKFIGFDLEAFYRESFHN